MLVAKHPPFTWGSEALIVQVQDDGSIPAIAVKDGFEYLLECDEIVPLLSYLNTKRLGTKGRAEFIIHYAMYDAGPAWANDIPDV